MHSDTEARPNGSTARGYRKAVWRAAVVSAAEGGRLVAAAELAAGGSAISKVPISTERGSKIHPIIAVIEHARMNISA